MEKNAPRPDRPAIIVATLILGIAGAICQVTETRQWQSATLLGYFLGASIVWLIVGYLITIITKEFLSSFRLAMRSVILIGVAILISAIAITITSLFL